MEMDSTPKAQIIQLNEGAIRDHLGEMVRSTVEYTLNRSPSLTPHIAHIWLKYQVRNLHLTLIAKYPEDLDISVR